LHDHNGDWVSSFEDVWRMEGNILHIQNLVAAWNWTLRFILRTRVFFLEKELR
jgi:hypothetical protein